MRHFTLKLSQIAECLLAKSSLIALVMHGLVLVLRPTCHGTHVQSQYTLMRS